MLQRNLPESKHWQKQRTRREEVIMPVQCSSVQRDWGFVESVRRRYKLKNATTVTCPIAQYFRYLAATRSRLLPLFLTKVTEREVRVIICAVCEFVNVHLFCGSFILVKLSFVDAKKKMYQKSIAQINVNEKRIDERLHIESNEREKMWMQCTSIHVWMK